MRTATPFKLRGIALNPPVDRGMIDRKPTFSHHFFEVTIAERIAEIPTDT
jgi:hypothetical protein